MSGGRQADGCRDSRRADQREFCDRHGPLAVRNCGHVSPFRADISGVWGARRGSFAAARL
jgi:hypothetical protein